MPDPKVVQDGVTQAEVSAVSTLLETNVEELANTLRISFEPPILHSREWRPLAEHVLGLSALAVQRALEFNQRYWKSLGKVQESDHVVSVKKRHGKQ